MRAAGHLLIALAQSDAAWHSRAPLSTINRPLLTSRSAALSNGDNEAHRRTPSPHMLVPKAAALVLFVPWSFVIIVNNLPTDLRLRIQKSNFIQTGARMRTMRAEPPKVRGVRLPQEALVITATFKKAYALSDLEVLWAALLKCYGSKDLALQAAAANPTILNPSYSFCNTMLESRRVLLDKMNEGEALNLMLANPAVLQCGPSLEVLGATEIKSIATLRGLANGVPEALRLVLLGTSAAVVLLPVLANQAPELLDGDLVAGLKMINTALFAPIFAAAILYLLRAGSR